MGFTDSAEVVRYLGGIFETAFEDPELEPKLKATGLTLRFVYSEPETVIVVDFAAGTVRDATGDAPGEVAAETSAAMLMSAEVGNGYWQGKVNLPLAMAKGKIKVEGQVAPLLKLAPLSKKLYPVYIERLKADGRDDLVV